MPAQNVKSGPGAYNPLSFRPAQVTIIATALYLALLTVLLWTHLSVPPAPSQVAPQDGLNLTQAWRDLEELSKAFRPWNSHRNEVVKSWLLERVKNVVANNGKSFDVVNGFGRPYETADGAVVAWLDASNNVTFHDDWRKGQNLTVYTESQNLIVYVRGSDDEKGAWWDSPPYKGKGGVLVNAHYDSVSTGYGATDDGVGIITLLQLISYFTVEGQRPKRGVIFLFNNGEEDGLYGAHAFVQHATSSFPRMFLNLEGAGAGGRAMLFRSTDAEVTSFYAHSKHPFGSVVSADGFKRGLVRSGTDYSVFTNDLGLRGLDVAFMEPRSRYHTNQDDARDTDLNSVWHMLSAALSTTEAMTSYTDDDFEEKEPGSDGVWFDVLGSAFAVCKLHTLFALCVALLVTGPVILTLLEIFIVRQGKWYAFSRRHRLRSGHDDGQEADADNGKEAISLHGVRGFFRTPFALAIAAVTVSALAFLLAKLNPYIVYRSPFAVWALLLSAFFVVSWFLLNLGDRLRPTALMRWYSLLWIYVLSWLGLVLATIGSNEFGTGGSYWVLIYHASILAALIVGYLEFFALPKRQQYAEDRIGVAQPSDSRDESSRAREDEEATERTGLLRRGDRRTKNTFTGFTRHRNREEDDSAVEETDPLGSKAYSGEQVWSGALPTWTWTIQYLLVVPINVILVGQMALLLTSALHQTPTDGNPVLIIYLLMAGCTILLLTPMLPFLQRFTFHVPLVLFVALVACLIWTLLAFPFDREARMKYYFVQTVDLQTGTNNVTLSSLEPYVHEVIAQMPSAAGKQISCSGKGNGLKDGLTTCRWHGISPEVVSNHTDSISHAAPSSKYSDWLHYNITALNSTSALFTLRGRDTKNCRILFSSPVRDITVSGAMTSPDRQPTLIEGSTQLRLYSREWAKEFKVHVSWAEGDAVQGQKGSVGCMWAEADKVPALTELKRFAPVWSTVTKSDDGLVEGWYEWEI